MTVKQQHNLEELLEVLGSKEIPGDTDHRYALRRALLNSRYFESNTNSNEFWSKLFAFTGYAVFGTATVAVVLVVVTFVQAPPATTSVVASTEPIIEIGPVFETAVDAELADAVEIPKETSAIKNPIILTDFSEVSNSVPVKNVVDFVNMGPVFSVR